MHTFSEKVATESINFDFIDSIDLGDFNCPVPKMATIIKSITLFISLIYNQLNLLSSYSSDDNILSDCIRTWRMRH